MKLDTNEYQEKKNDIHSSLRYLRKPTKDEHVEKNIFYLLMYMLTYKSLPDVIVSYVSRG